jgi:hypothetical protein
MYSAAGWTRLVLICVVLISLPALSNAQVIIGRVVEADGTAQPIKHATLELLDDRADVVTRVVVDSLGVFRMRSWHPGKYKLKTQAIGYATVTSETLELATGDRLELTVRLATNAVPLEPIVVKVRARESLAEIALSGYYDRRDAGRRLGLGRFFDRGALAGRGKRLTDVLRTIPGVRVINVQNCPVPLVTMAGNSATRLEEIKTDQLVRLSTMAEACKPASVCRANVYVDGVQMAFDETISVDQTVPMEWVEAIEVYRRASEIPAEFLGRATCGVVAVWTRRG